MSHPQAQTQLPDDDPVDPSHIPEWSKIEEYPDNGNRIRGTTIYRTRLPAPLAYRVVLETNSRALVYRIPVALYRPNMFPTRHVQYGFKLPWEPKVLGWHETLPAMARIYNGAPDFTEYSMT
jgi:hypothetical protein